MRQCCHYFFIVFFKWVLWYDVCMANQLASWLHGININTWIIPVNVCHNVAEMGQSPANPSSVCLIHAQFLHSICISIWGHIHQCCAFNMPPMLDNLIISIFLVDRCLTVGKTYVWQLYVLILWTRRARVQTAFLRMTLRPPAYPQVSVKIFAYIVSMLTIFLCHLLHTTHNRFPIACPHG